MERFLLKFALLSASFLLVSSYAVAVCLPDYKQMFPTYDDASIEFLMTISAFAVMIVMFLSDFVSRKIGKKNTVLLGLVVVTISSFISYYATTYNVMLFSRIIYGIGLGLINALAISLIADFFKDNECATMMGLRNAVEGLGQTVTVAIAGFIYAAYGFAFVPFVYLLAIVIFVVFFFFVPSDDKASVVEVKEEVKEISQDTKTSFIPWEALPHCLILLFTVLVSVGFFVKMFDLFELKNIQGDPNAASTILTVISFCTMAGGCVFGLIYSKIKYWTLPLSLLLTALSCIALYFAESLSGLYVACIINGAAYPLVISYIFNMISSLSHKTSSIIVTSWMLIGCNIGAFAAPLGFVAVNNAIVGATASTAFLVFGIIFLVILAGSFVFKSRFIITD